MTQQLCKLDSLKASVLVLNSYPIRIVIGANRVFMICPRCKSEYRAGFDRCADCGIALVEDDEANDAGSEEIDSSELVSALQTMDSLFLSDVIALIEEHNIPYLLQSGTALGLDPSSDRKAFEWRAVLYVFPESVEEVQIIIGDVRQERKNRLSATDEKED